MKQRFDLKCMYKTAHLVWELDRVMMTVMILGALIDAALPYVGILLSAYILDGLSSGTGIVPLAITAVSVVGGIFALTILRAYIRKIFEVHMELVVRKYDTRMIRRTLTMDYQLLDSPVVNDIRNRVKSDNNWGAGFYSVIWMLPAIFQNAIGVVVSTVILVPLFMTSGIVYNAVSIAILAGLAGTAIFGAVHYKIKSNRYTAMLGERSSKRSYGSHFLWSGSFDYKTGKDVRLYNALPLMARYMDEDRAEHTEWVANASRLSWSRGFVMGAMAGLLQGGAYLFVVLQGVTGALGVGAIVKYASSIFKFFSALTSLTRGLTEFNVISHRMQSTLEYVDVKDVLYKGTIPVEKRDDNDYTIEFHNVSFKYPGTDAYALRNLNMKLHIGQRLAVVGMNGSGKTTMIKLLCRLYDPTEGEITLNGIDIRKYDYAEYMGIFSVVFQDFKLFSFSLGQNIATNVAYDEGKAVDCLHKAGLSDRLSSMPKGLDTTLYKDFDKDGVEISGGEAQKIALARALYKNAPFIVLDEPTAALDPIAEYEIYARFNDIVGDKTAIYISHRLSSCRFCDDIAVFHEGQLIQRGSHDALIAEDHGKYHELWYAQAQYYDESATCDIPA